MIKVVIYCDVASQSEKRGGVGNRFVICIETKTEDWTKLNSLREFSYDY